MSFARAKLGHRRAMGQIMGDIILFSPRRQSGFTRRHKGESFEAQIMFFTGVRYQRMTDATTDTGGERPNSAGGKRKRKRG